jgi:long-subunit acyl-CoA synthetase (AMP-forming)
MSRVLAAIRDHAQRQPRRLALQDGTASLNYRDLLAGIERLAERLRRSAPRAVALLADNSCAWVVADLALHAAGTPAVPLPLFFSPAQIAHAIRASGVDHVITDQPDRVRQALQLDAVTAEPFCGTLQWVTLPVTDVGRPELPAGTTKVTFTSGTTGEPKGVCLGRDQIEDVAESLRVASLATASDRHLCLLPLATLLENIAGVYTPLLAGAVICVPRLADVGLTGSSGLDAARLAAALNTWRASSAITVPQTLQAIVAAAQAGAALPRTLRYVAVGGAPVSNHLLETAESLGLPVYEGFGLSECASVVAVNRPGDSRRGSVGRPLAHVRIEFAADGEILVRGVAWRGYLGSSTRHVVEPLVATGDLGHLDNDGFLHITGRKKNIFITSFGRNVAPEWIERELVSRAPVLQAAVFGEGRSFNTAVVFARPGASANSIDTVIEAANRLLPDYARVRAWIAATTPFSPANGMLTPNGRPRRDRILAGYAEQIDAIYCVTQPIETMP